MNMSILERIKTLRDLWHLSIHEVGMTTLIDLPQWIINGFLTDKLVTDSLGTHMEVTGSDNFVSMEGELDGLGEDCSLTDDIEDTLAENIVDYGIFAPDPLGCTEKEEEEEPDDDANENIDNDEEQSLENRVNPVRFSIEENYNDKSSLSVQEPPMSHLIKMS